MRNVTATGLSGIYEVRKSDFETTIKKEIGRLTAMLIQKNKKYGNSALNPVRIFSRADRVEQLRVRLDDKLSRIARNRELVEDEDVLLDLWGYLTLLYVAQRESDETEQSGSDV